MKVWIVDDPGYGVVAAFSTLEKAERHIDKHFEPDGIFAQIIEMEVW